MKTFMKKAKDSNLSTKLAYTEEAEVSTRSQSLENTNDILFNQNKDFILNKKLVKISKKPKAKRSSHKTFFSKSREFYEDMDEINTEKWFKNKINITFDEKNPKKAIYKYISEDKPKSHSPLLFAKKENGIYVIRNNEGIVAKIRWNIFSNHFKVFDDKGNLIEEIIYNFNFKGWNGPTKLQILIPKTPIKTNSIYYNKNKKLVHKIGNKMPQYNDFFKTYVLNFINRNKIIPNEKNMQFTYSEYKEDNNNVLLQFAQINRNEFILDHKYPFNNIIAFAFGITALSSRTFCK